MLVLLGLFAAILRASSERQKLADWPPGSWLVMGFGAYSALSALTIFLIPGGRTYFLYNELLSYKAWIDQFLFYFILLTCIRNVETAKRCIVYMMIGSVLVVLYAVPEMLDKMGRSTIEKSRLVGPHLQSNNFGGFVAYTLVPLLAVFVVFIKDLRAWLLTPYFLLTAKVLITTFSRGAYLAMAAGALLTGWYKGKAFLAFWMVLAICFFAAFPRFIPSSITARMQSLVSNQASSAAPAEEKLDKSSSTRLIMWRAAGVMIMEDPILGKGFKAFPLLKEDYTEIPVKESDPHSMYLYIGSQMGLPALALFLVILLYSFNLGRYHARNETDQFIRAIGIGGAAATACYAVVCVFGSRAVSLNFTAYFWTYFVVMQVIKAKAGEVVAEEGSRDTGRKARKQRAARTRGAAAARMAVVADDESVADELDVAPLVKLSQGGAGADTGTSRQRRQRKQAVSRNRPTRGAAAWQQRQREAQPQDTHMDSTNDPAEADVPDSLSESTDMVELAPDNENSAAHEKARRYAAKRAANKLLRNQNRQPRN